MKAFAEVLAAQSFEVQQPGQNTFRDVRRLTSKGRCDLLLVDLNAPLTSGAAMLEQLQRRGDVPLVFVGDSKCFERHAKELEPLLAQRDVDWVTTSAGHSEFGWRVSKMAAQSMPALTTWNIPELRSDRSGRLDAVRVAKRFGMTLTELSKALRRSVQAVHKTPDSPGLQQRLRQF